MAIGSYDNALHSYYLNVMPMHTLVGKASPILDRISKSEIEGKETGVAFTLQGGMGISGDLVSAQEVAHQADAAGSAGNVAGASAVDGEWLVPTGLVETALRLKYKHLVAGKSNKGAYFRNLVHQTDLHVEAFGERIAQILHGSGGYASVIVNLDNIVTGVVSSIVSLTNPVTDGGLGVGNLYKGQILVASANDGTGAHTLLPSSNAPQKLYVMSVDRDAGTAILSSTSVNGPAGISGSVGANGNDRALFPLGQFRPLLGGTGLLMQTLSQWITPTVATDIFGSVDRNQDPALSGVRVPTAITNGLPLEHRLGFSVSYGQSRFAWRHTPVFSVQSEKWFELVRSLQAQGLVGDIGSTLTSGAKSIRISTVNGMAEVVSEPHQDPSFAYALNMDSIMIRHLDGFPGIANKDGFKMLRYGTSNDLEFRLICFPQLIVREPWMNARINLL